MESKACSVKAFAANISHRGALCCTNKRSAAGTACSLASDYCVLVSSVDAKRKASASFPNSSVCLQLQKALQSD